MDTLTTLFVVPTGNTLPTTGTNADLTGTQFGIYRPDQSPATVGNVGSSKYIFFSQNRNISSPAEGTKNSDFILPGNLIDWYKVTGSSTINYQVTKISDLTVGCHEDVSITLRLDSYYIKQAFFNGLTRSVLVTTPCCNCGSNPCDTLSGADVESTMLALAQAINDDILLGQFVTAGTQGTGTSTAIIISGNPLTSYASSCDLTNFPYQADRLSFWTFVRTGPELTTDYEVDDACNTVGTVTILEHASYPKLLPAEIAQLEKDYFSYQAEYGSIFSNPNYNGEFQSYIDSTSAYDLYYLIFKEPIKNTMNVGVNPDEETVILAFPHGDAGETSALAVLTAIFGTPTNEIASPITTTTFTTSSTTTTTTTSSPTP